MTLWLKQSTAATVVLGPFVDATDGVSPETGLSVTQAETRLSKNGGAFAQKNDANTASHGEEGNYLLALDATDTGTLGRLRVSVYIAGALPVWADFMVLPANVFDSLVSGSDTLDVQVTGMGAGVVTAAAVATDAIDSDALAGNAAAEIAGYVWAEATRTLTALDEDSTTLDIDAAVRAAVGLASANLDTQIAAVQADTDNIQTRLPAALVSGRMDSSVGAMAADVMTAAAAAADLTTELQSGLATAASIAALNNLSAAQVNAEVDAALADYDAPTKAELDAGLDALPTAAETADAVWDEAIAGHVGAGSAGERVERLDLLQTGGAAELTPARAALLANLDAAISTRASQTSVDTIDTEVGVIDGIASAIVADTNELQTDWANGGRLDLILDARAAQTTADAIETDTQNIQTRLPAALVSGRMDASVGAMAADVLTASALAADAVTEIWAKAMSDIAAVPGITASALDAINWLFALSRNLITQTATTQIVKRDDGSTTLGTSTHSDNGTTHTRGEWT